MLPRHSWRTAASRGHPVAPDASNILAVMHLFLWSVRRRRIFPVAVAVVEVRAVEVLFSKSGGRPALSLG